MGLACPFLSGDVCAIHEERPIVCREHLVTSPAGLCEDPASKAIRVIRPPVSLAEALVRLTRVLEGAPPEPLALPVALAWANDNRSRAHRTWPGTVIVQRFIDLLTEMVGENDSRRITFLSDGTQ